jgi:hypothetical protein
MDQRVSSSVNHPPYFDGNDYSQWKVMMTAFLISQDDGRHWAMAEDGWKHPMMPLAEGSEISIQKPKDMWNEMEITRLIQG